jgi:hypothetical protein
MIASQKPPERLEKRTRSRGAGTGNRSGVPSPLGFFSGVVRRSRKSASGRYPWGLLCKGGAAMELRFAQRARATKDLDLGIEGSRATRVKALSAVLRLAFDEFTFRVKPRTRDMEQADTIPIEVAVQYRTRSWQTIEVDLGPAKPDPVDLVDPHVQGLAELGIPGDFSRSLPGSCRPGCPEAPCLHGPGGSRTCWTYC